jgi:hypothetical protein
LFARPAGGSVVKTGRILRIPQSGPGLLMMEGRQHAFALEKTWRSTFPPEAGMLVEVEIDDSGQLGAVRGLRESQPQEGQDMTGAGAEKVKSSLYASDTNGVSMPTLAAAGALIVGWFVLSAVVLQTPVGNLDFTFWQVLGVLNSNGPLDGLLQGGGTTGNPGVYGLAALVALAGPFIHYAWNDRRAFLGAMLPLIFTFVAGIVLRDKIGSMLRVDGDAGSRETAAAMRSEIMTVTSLGVGSYLSMVASFYLGLEGLRHFLAASAKAQEQNQEFRAAA